MLISCTSESDPEFTPESGSVSYFSKSLDFTSDGGSSTITFTSNKDWTISTSTSGGDVSWCTVSPSSGKAGTNTVTVTTTQNTSYDDRNATLIFKVQDLLTNLVVTQKQKDALTITTAKYEVGAEGGTINVEVKANIDFQIEIPTEYSSWIHQATSRALTSSNITFTIDKSEEYDKREGEIIVRSGISEEILHVYQAGGGILLLSQNEYNISSEGEEIVVEISSNFEYDVINPEVDWITPITTRSLSSHTLYYKIDPNDTYDNREAEIIFRDANSDVSNSLKINQNQKDAIILSQKEYEFDAKGGSFTVDIASNIEYSIQIDADWITKIETKALSNSSVSFTVSEIPNDLTSRDGYITIINDEIGISEKIHIKQTSLFYLTTNNEEVMVGDSIQLTLINNLDNKDVEWSSSDTSIANVDEDGKIIGIAKGNCTITVKSIGGEYSASCDVTVSDITDYVYAKVYSTSTSFYGGYVMGQISTGITNLSGKPIKLKEIQLIDTLDGTDIRHLSIDNDEINETGVAYTITIKIMIYKPIIRWVYTYNDKEYYTDCTGTFW
jgi:uncharacterized protein YjdB